jgi:hypothetical protein
MRPREYTFTPLPVIHPGCTLAKYVHLWVRSHGRELLMEAVQEYHGDLPIDPWGPGNLEDPEDFNANNY